MRGASNTAALCGGVAPKIGSAPQKKIRCNSLTEKYRAILAIKFASDLKDDNNGIMMMVMIVVIVVVIM